MSVEMNGSLDRLAAAAGMLEEAVARLSRLEARVIEVQAASMALSELEEKLVSCGGSDRGADGERLRAALE